MRKKQEKEDGAQKVESSDDFKTQNSKLKIQIDELNEQLLRERADAANVRRRAEDEKIKLGGFYKALVVKELLPVIDNFERGMKLSKSESDFEKGMAAVYKQFGDVLNKLGVERIKTVGEHFDPNTMEAVTMEEGDGEHEIVSEELQSGYKMGDELLRPAMVRVKS